VIRFLPELKQSCISEPGNKQFWEHIKKAGREMGLISEWEAQKYGGISNVSEAEAIEVRSGARHLSPTSYI
jgi:ATP-dependent DNA helicase 2 subunit 2